jgi:hypothetical protein
LGTKELVRTFLFAMAKSAGVSNQVLAQSIAELGIDKISEIRLKKHVK